MESLQKICLVLTIIGALNWGMVGIFDFNLVESLFGNLENTMPRIIYAFVGLAGIINIGLLITPLHEVKK